MVTLSLARGCRDTENLEENMEITIISGSHRKSSQSRKISEMLLALMIRDHAYVSTDILDLSDHPLPLWDESIWTGEDTWKKRLYPLKKRLQKTDGLVIVSPEWHGMVPSALKNFFLMWTDGELAHKPALIVAVSASDGGSYPVSELRMSSYKNNRICYIPEQLIVRNVNSVFNEDSNGDKSESQCQLEDRMIYCLEVLTRYSQVMRALREGSGAIDISCFPYGM